MAEKSVKLSTSSFRDIPICELCLEDALNAGAAKSEKLKPDDFSETSIRFCIGGLEGMLILYSDEHYNNSLRRLLRDASWQWASRCEMDQDMLRVRAELSDLRHILSETNYVHLMDELTLTQWRLKELGYAKRPTNVHLPNGSYGIINRSATALGISFSRFFQIGLAWSLSTNGMGLYSPWIKGTVDPIMSELKGHCQKRRSLCASRGDINPGDPT